MKAPAPWVTIGVRVPILVVLADLDLARQDQMVRPCPASPTLTSASPVS